MKSANLDKKSTEYEAAMDSYTGNPVYKWWSFLVAISIVSLQAIGVLRTDWYDANYAYPIYFSIAYVAADFVNGAVHMWMDNNSRYTGLAGPLVAAFHQHHHRPLYTTRNPVFVYFFESGMKNWLLPVMAFTVIARPYIPSGLTFGLLSFGILSSVAEVSHYWCHNSGGRLVRVLQGVRVLLPKKHHERHHELDNVNYAFLNGCTDPLLNAIASRLYAGYAHDTDLHGQRYNAR